MNEGTAYKLKMAPPVVIELESVDGLTKLIIDAYEARRMLAEAEKKGNEPDRWLHVRLWLAGKLGTTYQTLAESMAIEFNNTVLAIVEHTNEERKKKVESIVSSPQSIQASQDGCC